MTPQPIIDRLKAEVAGLHGRVFGAVEFAAAEQNLARTPAAFVIPVADTGGQQQYATGMSSQRLTERFGVAIAVRNVADARGAAATADITVLKDAVRDALFGWLHPDMETPTTFARGRAVNFGGGTAWWLSEFEATTHIRKQ